MKTEKFQDIGIVADVFRTMTNLDVRAQTGRFAVAFATLLIVLQAATAAPETIRLRADQWMPYNGDPKAGLPGYVVEVAKMIFEPKGITIDYQTMPWSDALKAAAAGEIEGVIGANPTEAQGLLLPSEPMGQPRVGLFAKKTNPWKFANVPALREIRLGAIDGYSYWESLDAYLKKQTGPEVVVFKGEAPLKDGIAKLDAGGIDVMVETVAVWVWTVKELGRSPGDYKIAYMHQAEAIFVAFAPKGDAGKRYAAIWDAGVQELRKNGKMAAVLEKYSVVDWK
jgi:polar amino acid transport system substrate-binding protein